MDQIALNIVGAKFNSVNAWDFLDIASTSTAIGPIYADVPCGIAYLPAQRNFGYRGQTSRRAYNKRRVNYHTCHPYHP